MTELAETVSTEQVPTESDKIVFYGQRRNMAMGVAMLGGGAAAFVAGLTSTFFAEAIAWTFVLWGVFFLYGDLLLATRRGFADKWFYEGGLDRWTQPAPVRRIRKED